MLFIFFLRGSIFLFFCPAVWVLSFQPPSSKPQELVVDQIKPRLERLAKKNMPGLCPVAEIGCIPTPGILYIYIFIHIVVKNIYIYMQW